MDISKLTPQSTPATDGEESNAKAQAEEQLKREMLATVLEQDARERRRSTVHLTILSQSY